MGRNSFKGLIINRLTPMPLRVRMKVKDYADVEGAVLGAVGAVKKVKKTTKTQKTTKKRK